MPQTEESIPAMTITEPTLETVVFKVDYGSPGGYICTITQDETEGERYLMFIDATPVAAGYCQYCDWQPELFNTEVLDYYEFTAADVRKIMDRATDVFRAMWETTTTRA